MDIFWTVLKNRYWFASTWRPPGYKILCDPNYQHRNKETFWLVQHFDYRIVTKKSIQVQTVMARTPGKLRWFFCLPFFEESAFSYVFYFVITKFIKQKWVRWRTPIFYNTTLMEFLFLIVKNDFFAETCVFCSRNKSMIVIDDSKEAEI